MAQLTFLTQTRKENPFLISSVKSIIEGIDKHSFQNNINLVVNFQSKEIFSNEIVENDKKSFLKVIKTPLLSLSKARNLLLDYSIKNFENSNFFITVDDDIKIDNLENFYNTLFYSNNKKVQFDFGCALLIFEDTKRPFSRHMKKSLLIKKEPFLMKKENHNIVLGSGLVFSKKIINDGLRFDDKLGLGAEYGGSEETDIFLTSIEKGYNCLFLKNSIILHPRLNFERYGFSKMYLYGKGRGYTYKKHLNKDKMYYMSCICKSLLLNLVGINYGLFSFNKVIFTNQLGLFCGKLVGFLK